MAGLSDEEFFKSRGFGLRMGFGRRPALLVIDLIKAFTDAERPLGANLDAQIAVTQKLLEVAHEYRVPVFFSTLRYDESDLRDAGLWAPHLPPDAHRAHQPPVRMGLAILGDGRMPQIHRVLREPS